MLIDLTQMRPGEYGIVQGLCGRCDFEKRLQGMGIRPGKKIKKISSHFWRGPQTIEVGNARFGVGFGMAKKILIQVER